MVASCTREWAARLRTAFEQHDGGGEEENEGGVLRGDERDLYFFEIKGSAFLYHQVRCITAVLMAVGRHLETPDVVDRLLDVDTNPRRPNYELADESPLILYDCGFDPLLDGGVDFRVSPDALQRVCEHLDRTWSWAAARL